MPEFMLNANKRAMRALEDSPRIADRAKRLGARRRVRKEAESQS